MNPLIARRRTPSATQGRRRTLVLTAVALVLLVSAGLRFWSLGTPNKIIFDEVYYAKDAKAIVDGRMGQKQGGATWEPGDVISWPHPQYGILAISLGILAFGDEGFGWRFMPALAGITLLALLYPLARRLGLSRGWALAALVLAASDLLGIVQSRIATLDIFVALWTVLCVYLALRYVQDGHRWYWLALCGIAGGLALGTKWSGALALLAAAAVVALFRRRHPEAAATLGRAVLRAASSSLLPAVLLVLLPAALYVASYAFYFAAGHGLADWWEMQRQALTFNLHLSAEHAYASAPPTWMINFRPIWYYYESSAEYHGIVAMGNPALWWSAALALVALPMTAIVDRDRRLAVPALLVALLYLPWFGASRTSFLYYMTPVAPFMAVMVAAGLQRVTRQRLRWPRMRPSQPEGLPAAGGDDGREHYAVVAFLAAALVTALLWRHIGAGAEWLFWRLPAQSSRLLAYFVSVVVTLAGCFSLTWLVVSPARRWVYRVVGWAYVGVVAGLAVAFMPIAIDIGISPDRYYDLIWFRTWI